MPRALTRDSPGANTGKIDRKTYLFKTVPKTEALEQSYLANFIKSILFLSSELVSHYSLLIRLIYF
jgi:hypothetical protein